MVSRWAKHLLSSRSYLIFLLCFLFVIDAIVLWYACARDYSRTVERAEIVLQKTCISLEERVRRTVVATEAILSNRALRIQEVGIKETISSAGERARFQTAAEALPDPGSLWLLDEKADLLLDSTQYPSQPVSFSEREYFPQHRDTDVQLYIGPVVKGKVTNKYSFTISHRLTVKDKFSGVIVAAMETDGFTDFLRNIDIGKGSTVSVFRTDGSLILRQPMQDEYIGKNFGNLKLFGMPLNEKPSGIFESSAIDGTRRFLAYRKVPGLPLLVATGIPVDSVLEQWRKRVIINSVVAGVVFIVLMGLSAVVYRTTSREEKERAAELSSINEALHAEILTRKQVEVELQKSRDDLEMRVKKRTAQLAEQTELMNSMSAYNRSLIEASIDPLVTINPEGRITDVNMATERITGHSREELIGTDFSEYFTDPEKARAGYLKAFEEGIVRDYELGILHKDQHVTPVLYNASVYRDENGKVIGVFAAARDITEQRRLEEQLVQSHKMEAIGTMAGGIAHDFNNILASIVGFTEMAQEDVPDSPGVQRSLKMVLKSAYRARELVKQILTFSRKTTHERNPLSLTPIIKETVQLLRASIPAMIDINLFITATSDVVLASPVEVQQIVMNLANNAALAMQEKGGTLEVGLHDSNQDQGMLELVIRDTGAGMGPEVMKRIWDPFFTTREVGKGTGMGLPVVYGIVKDLKGAITVKSSPGEGSTFRVVLSKADLALHSEPVEIPNISGGTERVLFVEDEEMLAEWGRATLERLGYKVNVATDGAEALRIFSSNPNFYDLVITDYAMPRMPGSQLASELIKQRSNIPIILCTGYSETLSPEQARQLGIRRFLTKPLARYELAIAVRETLDSKAQQAG